MKIVGVIPARYGSSRFPGKPLADICGKPMVWWVYQRARQAADLEKVIVAADDDRIIQVCDNYKIPAVMTSPAHRNGTERVSEAARKIEADIYVTIQGDEPLLEPSAVKAVLQIIMNDGHVECATLKTPYHDPVDVINGTMPKVVTDLNDDVLLFSRSPIPYPKENLDYIIYKPIGVYAFRRGILLKYADLEMGPLERAEGIELLRLVEHGYKIRAGNIQSDTVAVDTHKDAERVRQFILSHPEYAVTD